jgi:hypothetical protein
MCLDGLLTDAKHLRDMLAATSFRDEPEDLLFAARQSHAVAMITDADGRAAQELF